MRDDADDVRLSCCVRWLRAWVANVNLDLKEYPADERQWLLATAYNTGLGCHSCASVSLLCFLLTPPPPTSSSRVSFRPCYAGLAEWCSGLGSRCWRAVLLLAYSGCIMVFCARRLAFHLGFSGFTLLSSLSRSCWSLVFTPRPSQSFAPGRFQEVVRMRDPAVQVRAQRRCARAKGPPVVSSRSGAQASCPLEDFGYVSTVAGEVSQAGTGRVVGQQDASKSGADVSWTWHSV